MAGVRGRWIVAAGLALAAVPATSAQDLKVPAVATIPPDGMQSATVVGLAAPGAAPMPPPPDQPPPGLTRWERRKWRHAMHKRKMQEHFLGFPEEFREWPQGRAMYTHGQTMVSNATAASMVFYDYDFVQGTDQLNLKGKDKLYRVATMLPTNFYPVVVERTPRTPGVDERRRLALLSLLAQGPSPVPAQRVLIGPSIANGLSGREALLVDRNLINQTLSGGNALGFGAPVGGSGYDSSGILGGASGVSGSGSGFGGAVGMGGLSGGP